MARTLSDMVIVAMIESATRLASVRGPITGVIGHTDQMLHGTSPAASTPEEGAPAEGAAGEGTGVTTPAGAASGGSAGTPPVPPSEHDTRTAAQIAADFKTVYLQMEELVRNSAEQESKSVGFGLR